MLCGFGASLLFEKPSAPRDRALLRWGPGTGRSDSLLLRALDVYGDPNPWQTQATITDGPRFPQHHEVSAEPRCTC